LLLTALHEFGDAVHRGDDDTKLKLAIRSAMGLPFFNKFLMAAAIGRYLADDETWQEQVARSDQLRDDAKKMNLQAAPIPFFMPADRSYLQFGLPGETIILARGLNRWQTADQQLRPFCQAVRFVDRPLLTEIFGQLASLLDAELGTVQRVQPDLLALLQAHTHCVCRLYVANYGAEPMLIRAQAELRVRQDRKRPVLGIPCGLAEIQEDRGLSRLLNGFLLSAGS